MNSSPLRQDFFEKDFIQKLSDYLAKHQQDNEQYCSKTQRIVSLIQL